MPKTKWCPLCRIDCREGYVSESSNQCIFWDSINESCVYANVAFLTHDQLSTQRQGDELPEELAGDDAGQ